MADLPPCKWQFEIHTDRFLLWELRQIKWQIYPPTNGNLRFILIDSYSESSDRSSGRSTPLQMAIWDSYWQIPTLTVQADQVADLPLHKWQFEIHTDRFLLWELRQIKWQIYPPANGNLRFILIDSCSDSSGTPGSRSTGRCNPHKWQFEIHTDRFLIWQFRHPMQQINW